MSLFFYLAVSELSARLAGEKLLSKRRAVLCLLGLVVAALPVAAGDRSDVTVGLLRVAGDLPTNLFTVSWIAVLVVYVLSFFRTPAHPTAGRLVKVLALYALLLVAGLTLYRAVPGAHILPAAASVWLAIGSGFALVASDQPQRLTIE